MKLISNRLFYIFIFVYALCVSYIGFNHFTLDGLSNLLYQSDYYINYSAGFIRRGLDGEIIYGITSVLGTNAVTIQKVYNLVFFCIFICVIIRFFYKYRIPVFIVLSNTLLLVYLLYITNDLRKDHIMIILILLMSGILKSRWKTIIKKITVVLVLIIGTLSHEIFFLLAIFPLLCFYMNFKLNLTKDFFINALPLIIPLIIFLLLVTIFKGNNNTANIIIDSWRKYGLVNLQFNKGLFDGTLFIWKSGISFLGYLGLGFTLVSHFFFISLLFKNKRKEVKNQSFFLLGTVYLACLILCFVGIDFSRWIFLCNMTFLIFYYQFIHEAKEDVFFPKLSYIIMAAYFFIGMPYSKWDLKSWLISTPFGFTAKHSRDLIKTKLL